MFVHDCKKQWIFDKFWMFKFFSNLPHDQSIQDYFRLQGTLMYQCKEKVTHKFDSRTLSSLHKAFRREQDHALEILQKFQWFHLLPFWMKSRLLKWNFHKSFNSLALVLRTTNRNNCSRVQLVHSFDYGISITFFALKWPTLNIS